MSMLQTSRIYDGNGMKRLQDALYYNNLNASLSNCPKNKVRCEIRDPITWRVLAAELNGLEDDKDCRHETNSDGSECKCAERRALKTLENQKMSAQGMVAIVNLSPCIHCANAMIQSGIGTIVFTKIFKEREGIIELVKKGKKIYHYTEGRLQDCKELVKEWMRNERR